MSLNLDLRKCNISSLNSTCLKFDDLQIEYYKLVSELNYKFYPQMHRTVHEFRFEKLLRDHTKLQVLSSYWIGSYCFDFFIPTLGLTIEVDGSIHNTEFKGVKDQSKVDSNRSIGVMTYSVENMDFRHECVLSLLNYLSFLPKKDSRSRKRLLRTIYLKTIISNLSDEEIKKRFAPGASEIREPLKQI